MVRTQRCHCRGPGLAPGGGASIPQAAWRSRQNKTKHPTKSNNECLICVGHCQSLEINSYHEHTESYII